MTHAGTSTPTPYPRVSIVTPSFMRAGFIRMCLDSVAAQEYPNIEHIVVDGGSTDGTVEILREYEESHGLRWVSEPDSGMYDAVNKGLELATGDIVAYLNTDDAYFPWSVRVAVEALRETQADAVYGDLLVIHGEPADLHGAVMFYEPFDMFHYTFIGSIGQPTMFWQRDVSRRLGPFSLDYRLIADCEYWLRMGSRGLTLRHIPEVLALQLEHETTLRETNAQELSEEFERLREQYSRAAGSGSAALRRIRLGVVWRFTILPFLWHWATGRGRRWAQFVGFLRASGVPFPLAYAFLSPLPKSLRRTVYLIAHQPTLSRLTAGAGTAAQPNT